MRLSNTKMIGVVKEPKVLMCGVQLKAFYFFYDDVGEIHITQSTEAIEILQNHESEYEIIYENSVDNLSEIASTCLIHDVVKVAKCLAAAKLQKKLAKKRRKKEEKTNESNIQVAEGK